MATVTPASFQNCLRNWRNQRTLCQNGNFSAARYSRASASIHDPSSVNWATSCADSWSSRRISGDKSWQKAWHLECSNWDFWASHAKSKDPGTDGKPLNTTGTPVVLKLQRHFTEMVPQLGHKLLGKNAQTDWYGLVSHSQPTGVGHWNKWHAFTVQGQC